MAESDISRAYRDHTACFNRQDWRGLHQFSHEDVDHNGQRLGSSGHRAMLEKDFAEIPDLRFDIRLLVCDPPHVVGRLAFECSPAGSFAWGAADRQPVLLGRPVRTRLRPPRAAAAARAPTWLLGLGLGLLAAVVGWFVVAPVKGQPMASGFVPMRMLIFVLINGTWGIGVGVVFSLLGAKRPTARA